MGENVIQIKSGIRISVKIKKHCMCKEDYIWNPATCSCQNESIIDKSVTMCDKTMEETKTVPTYFNEKKKPVKQKVSIFYLPFNFINDSC